MLILLYGIAFYSALTFDVFLKWCTPIFNFLFISFPSEKFRKTNSDIKAIINLICNYTQLFTMSKTNKSFSGQNVFYLNILHNFKNSFLLYLHSNDPNLFFFTLINVSNSQCRSHSRMGGVVFWFRSNGPLSPSWTWFAVALFLHYTSVHEISVSWVIQFPSTMTWINFRMQLKLLLSV